MIRALIHGPYDKKAPITSFFRNLIGREVSQRSAQPQPRVVTVPDVTFESDEDDDDDVLAPLFEDFARASRSCHFQSKKLQKYVDTDLQQTSQTHGDGCGCKSVSPSDRSDEQFKLDYIRALIDFHDQTHRTLEVRVLQLSKEGSRSEDTKALLHECTETCVLMAQSFKEARGRPACIFRYAWEHTVSYLQSHPWHCAGVASGGAIVGATFGAIPGGIAAGTGLNLGIHSALVGSVGPCLATPVGALIGAGVGLLLFAAWACYESLKERKPKLAQEAVDQRKEIQRIIDELDLTHIQADDVRRLRDTFARCLSEPLILPSMAVGSVCSICLEEMTEAQLQKGELERAPHCTGAHFHHASCLDRNRKFGRFQCPLCRQ